MKKTLPILSLAALVIPFALLSCAAEHSAATDEASAAVETPDTGAPAAAEEVSFEPAYPTEVSAEGLDDADVAQQETTHSHGEGDEHTHGDGDEHTHGDGDEHSHDDGNSSHHPEGDGEGKRDGEHENGH